MAQKGIEHILDPKHGGTYCPECGVNQPHVHLGWLELPKGVRWSGGKGVLFTQVNCKRCGISSIIVSYKDIDRYKLSALERAIRGVF